MNRQVLIEENIGETRAAIVENGRIVELHLDRWSEAGERALEGEIYRGRVRRVEPALNAAFIDLGIGEGGFLPFGKAGRPKGFHEGAAIGVRIAREGYAEKGPNLALVDVDDGEAPECLEPAPILAQRLLRDFGDGEAVWADETDFDLDEAFDQALDLRVAIPGGGSLYIEQTRAMVTVDVDADGRKEQGNAQRLTQQLNQSAAKEAARQIRLRGLGGIIVIDFVHMRAQPDRKSVEQALRQSFKRDRAKVDVAPLSQFCLGELARQRRGRTLSEIMLDADGQPSAETAALAALRQAERELPHAKGRPVKLACGEAVADWLETSGIGWQEAFMERFGRMPEMYIKAELAPRAAHVEAR